MKLKLYSTVRSSRIEEAIEYTKEYLKGLDIELSRVDYYKENLKKKSIYEVVLSWALSIFKPTKSISTDYISSLEHEGYDGVVLFVDKFKAKEDGDLYGQHSVKNGKSYIEIYVTSYSYFAVKGAEGYRSNSEGALRSQVSHTLIHELFHAYSFYKGVIDKLHYFIEENHFEQYKDYLLTSTQLKSVRLYEETLKCVNTDVTPKDVIPDPVACAETVSTLINKVVPFPIIAGTYSLYEKLSKDDRFIRVFEPQKGDILIYPTKTGNGNLSNGHAFICGENNLFYSNDSESGLLKQNYTLSTARKRYVELGGFKEYFYRLIK